MAKATGRHRGEDRHDSGKTSSDPKSGSTGKHDASNPQRQAAKGRTDAGKLLGHGWTPGRKSR